MSDFEIYRTLPEQIAARLRQEVLAGKLQPNAALREMEISERFGVSRGPVREALRQLTQQGLFVLEPNKGVRVAPNPSTRVRPLVANLRREIEIFVLENVFDKLTDDDITILDSILLAIKAACESNDTGALVEHDLRFHRAIIEYYVRYFEDKDMFEIWQPVMMRMLMHYNRLDDLMESYREHERIVNAIRNRDKVAAIRALEVNIQ